MRLWNIHPKYLDQKGLLAVWREALLAKKVLEGKTKGYKNHPEIKRFQSQKDPLAAISVYLKHIWLEASRRGYSFDYRKIGQLAKHPKIKISSSQIKFEIQHLKSKLKTRAPSFEKRLNGLSKPDLHPLFTSRP